MDTLYNPSCNLVNNSSCLDVYNDRCRLQPMKTSLGQRLKAARKHAKLTQEALSERSGVIQQVISKIECDKQDATSYIVDLAVACGIDPEWLATGEGSMVSTVKYLTTDHHHEVVKEAQTVAYEVVVRPKQVEEAADLLAELPPKEQREMADMIRLVHKATVKNDPPPGPTGGLRRTG